MIIQRTAYDQFFFTEFVSKSKPVVKEFKANGAKEFDPRLGTCKYKRMVVTNFEELDAYMHKANYLTTMTLGLTYKFNGISETAEAYRQKKCDTYRGQECVKFYNDINPLEDNKYSILFLDIDFDKNQPNHFKCSSPEYVRQLLIKLLPILGFIGMLIRPSSSSHVYNSLTGEYREQGQSWHIFIFVANHTKQTNDNLKELLLRRSWRDDVNLATVKVDKNGILKNQTLLDMSVLASERLIAIAKPICQYPYCKQVVPSTIFKGEILNLSKVNPNSEEDYRPRLESKKRELLQLLDFSEFFDSSAIKATKATTKGFNQIISSNTNIVIPNVHDKSIPIDEDTQTRILEIYKVFHKKIQPKYQDIKKHLSDKVIVAFLTFLGFEIDWNKKFKIREERTPSSSVNYNGWIRDFGGTFSGNILNFLMELYKLDFKEAWSYFKACFGVKVNLKPKTKEVLPNPKNFEANLTLSSNY